MGIKALLGASAAAAVLAAPLAASAAVTVYDDPSTFLGSTTGVVGYAFPQAAGLQNVTPSYSLGGVTFTSSNLYEGNDLGYLGLAYLDSNTTELDVSTSSTALGFYLAAYAGAETVDYTVNGVSGSLDLAGNRQQTFLAFSSDSGPLSIVFNTPRELDVTTFATASVDQMSAAPEPATWALMMAGVGLAGMALRRRGATAVA